MYSLQVTKQKVRDDSCKSNSCKLKEFSDIYTLCCRLYLNYCDYFGQSVVDVLELVYASSVPSQCCQAYPACLLPILHMPDLKNQKMQLPQSDPKHVLVNTFKMEILRTAVSCELRVVLQQLNCLISGICHEQSVLLGGAPGLSIEGGCRQALSFPICRTQSYLHHRVVRVHVCKISWDHWMERAIMM